MFIAAFANAQTHSQTQSRTLSASERSLAVALLRSALAAVNHGNWTGNYTVLRDFASPNFAMSNDPTRLAAIFAPIRQQRFDLLPAMVLDPFLTVAEHTKEGHLRLSGYFPSQPKQIAFDLIFEPVDQRWRLLGIGISPVLPNKTQGNTAGGSAHAIDVPASASNSKSSRPVRIPVPTRRSGNR